MGGPLRLAGNDPRCARGRARRRAADRVGRRPRRGVGARRRALDADDRGPTRAQYLGPAHGLRGQRPRVARLPRRRRAAPSRRAGAARARRLGRRRGQLAARSWATSRSASSGATVRRASSRRSATCFRRTCCSAARRRPGGQGRSRRAPASVTERPGNGYALLRTYELTGDEKWLERARSFAMDALGPAAAALLALHRRHRRRALRAGVHRRRRPVPDHGRAVTTTR